MWYLLAGIVIGAALGWLLDWLMNREELRSLRDASTAKDAEIGKLKAALAAAEARGAVALVVPEALPASPHPAPGAPPEPEWRDPLTGELMEAYCVKCRTKRTISGPRRVSLSNGRPAVKGACPVCKSTLFRIVKL
jgi:hypothetical protein